MPAVRSVDPELAQELPRRLEAPLATLDRRDFASDTIELAEQVRFLALILPLLGIALLAATRCGCPTTAAWRCAARRSRWPRRRPRAAGDRACRARRHAPGGGAHARPGERGDRRRLGRARGPLRDGAPWRRRAVALGIALLVSRRGAARFLAPLGAAARSLGATPRDRAIRALRGTVCWPPARLWSRPTRRWCRPPASCSARLLVAWGSADLIGAVAGPAPAARRLRPALGAAGRPIAWRRRDRRRRPRAGARRHPGRRRRGRVRRWGWSRAGAPPRGPGNACNGSPELCQRRLNEVVFPGTHNSMSAAEEPGWLFANQRRSASSRSSTTASGCSCIDPHWGVPVAGNRVRTDLRPRGRAATASPRRSAPRPCARPSGSPGASGRETSTAPGRCGSATRSASWARPRCRTRSTPTATGSTRTRGSCWC